MGREYGSAHNPVPNVHGSSNDSYTESHELFNIHPYLDYIYCTDSCFEIVHFSIIMFRINEIYLTNHTSLDFANFSLNQQPANRLKSPPNFNENF